MTERFRPHAVAERVLVTNAPRFSTQRCPALPRRSVPSIAGLIAFEATARNASFSRAAKELALSQGAVSKRVRQLEEVLGVELLARSHHQVSLTACGRSYLADARRVLAEIEASTRALARQGPSRHVLTISVPAGLDSHWLIPRLKGFWSLHPKLQVNLVPNAAAIDFRDDRIDGAIHCMEDATGGVVLSRFIEEVLLPVAAPELLNASCLEAPEALIDLGLIHLDGQQDLWREWFAMQGMEVPANIDGPAHGNIGLVIAAAMHGHGVALVPHHMVAAALAQGLLAAPVRGLMPSGRVYAFSVPAEKLQDSAIGHFANWLESCARAHPATPVWQ